jgi:hypothetical protein
MCPLSHMQACVAAQWMVALGAARHMPAKRLGSAGFNRRHDLELGEADMPGIGLPPRRTMGTEDVSDLQPRPGHPGVRSLQASLHGLVLQLRQHLVGAHGVADRLGGHVGVARSGRELGMAEQDLETRTSVLASSRCVAKLWRRV